MAYVLRPHEVFNTPNSVDLQASKNIGTPAAFQRSIDDPQISVLPLVDDTSREYSNGWCTYTYKHVQAPELEVICGGVNAKTPEAAAIWRQGHLLHFGFEQSPGEMNENGRALLTNSICYIARFVDDRPIVRTPSVFYANNVRVPSRGMLDRAFERTGGELDNRLDYYLNERTRASHREMSRDELVDWYRANRGFLHADERGKLIVDPLAREFGVAPDADEFIPSAIARWRAGGESADAARKLLDRYVADAPGATKTTTPDDWQRWWQENRDYLFFTDTGGYCWHIDGLAKRRSVPTESLRGVARASLPPIAGPALKNADRAAEDE